MSPEERESMRQRLGQMQRMDPEKRKAARERFEAMISRTTRSHEGALVQHEFGGAPEMAKETQRMSPEERTKVIEKEGLSSASSSKIKGSLTPKRVVSQKSTGVHHPPFSGKNGFFDFAKNSRTDSLTEDNCNTFSRTSLSLRQ